MTVTPDMLPRRRGQWFGRVRRAVLTAAAALAFAAPLAAQAPTLRLDLGGQPATANGRTIEGAAAYPLEALRQLGGTVTTDARGATVLLLGDTLRFEIGAAMFRSGRTVHPLAFTVRRVDDVALIPEQFFIEWLPRRHAAVTFAGGVLRVAGAAGTVPAAAARPAASGQAAAAPPGAAARGGAVAPRGTPGTDPRASRRVVVIDPGHGGVDPGKIGVNGLREKDLTLTLGRRLQALLVERGYEVHMTRTTDTLVALADRPRIANRVKEGRPASLFVSIHANSAESRSVAGYETFFLAEARTADERRVAEIENAATRFEAAPHQAPKSDVDMILSGLRNDFYQRASNDFAAVVQRQMAGFHPGRNRGVKQAGFLVLVGAFMPAILVEVGFLSNPEEARLLGTAAFQQKLAWAMADAVDQYFREHEHLLVADPG